MPNPNKNPDGKSTDAVRPSALADMPDDDPAPPETELPDFDLQPALAQLRGRRSLLVYMHDNPDPDALAAAFGLKRLVEHTTGIKTTLALGGIIGRAENRAMVETLGIPLVGIESLNPADYDTLAIVDSQPETGNNSLPAGRPVDIVIDHHPAREESGQAPWRDIRPELGATSTILVEYLRAMNVPLDTPLATALFYALRAETRDLGREATHAERVAYLFLLPLVDFHFLSRISQPKVPREHFAALDRALRSAQVCDDVVVVNMGTIHYPDLVAEVADLLLKWEGARFVLCCGSYEDRFYLSLRTEPSERRAGTLMRQLIGAEGAAGGHGTMAGGRLYRPVANLADQQAIFERMAHRLLELIGRQRTPGTPLIGEGK
ncbi:MAG TPA: DHH family phosphoesterase [Polyangia bacterium]